MSSQRIWMFILLISVCPLLILTEDFHNVKFAPLTLTSVPYLNGEIAVYKHVNQSRYYLPPLAILQLNDTQVLKNRLTGRYMVRFALVLFTKQLHDTVLQYLQKNLNSCKNKSECQIKMIPIDRLRIVWKRLHTLSEEFELDPSWISNTILLNTIYFNIYCTTRTGCKELRQNVLDHPEIVDGLELEYNTPTEKHTRQEIEIKGSHIIKTNMFSTLKQMPTTGNSNTRYLLVDDMNILISEALSNVEMESITDVGYVSYDDQNLMRDLLKSRIAINQEVLMGHQARQWESVYWNSDNLRPDLTVKSLNDFLTRTNNENFNNTQRGVIGSSHRLNESDIGDQRDSFNDTSNVSASHNSSAGAKYTNNKIDKTTLTDVKTGDIRHVASSTATYSSKQDLSASSSDSSNSHYSSGGGSSGFFGIGARGGSSSGSSSSNRNSQLNYAGRTNADSGSNSQYTNNQKSDLNYQSGSKHDINSNQFSKADGNFQSVNNIRAQKIAQDEYRKMDEMDNFASTKLDSEALKKYNENRQYLELHGNYFDVKQVNAYRLNLGQFQESLRIASKSIVIQRINATHAIPIRALGDPLVLTPALEEYKITMDEKLVDLKNSLLDSINQTFINYKKESRIVLFETLTNATNVISNAFSSTSSANTPDNDFRILVKKALTKSVSLQDMGIFDNGILDYYRYDANPIENITIISLQPFKVGLHFSNAYIEGMVCDDKLHMEPVRSICRIYSPSTSNNPSYRLNGQYDQKFPACRFKTNYVNEEIPCPYIFIELICHRNSKTLKDCDYKRATRKDALRTDESVYINC